MIDLYTWTTPNGRKISIMLEETGTPYRVIPVDIRNGEQFKPEFVAICPNSKIPAIVDTEAEGGRKALFESGAILIYLAEKTGGFLPAEEPQRSEALQWLMYQMSHVGPILGQLNHFMNQAEEKIPYAIRRFTEESVRIIRVLDAGLAGREYLGGDYSIADMAVYPWVQAAWEPFRNLMPDQVGELSRVAAWLERVGERPAVVKGMAVPPS